jgi:hypothetical protein
VWQEELDKFKKNSMSMGLNLSNLPSCSIAPHQLLYHVPHTELVIINTITFSFIGNPNTELPVTDAKAACKEMWVHRKKKSTKIPFQRPTPPIYSEQ